MRYDSYRISGNGGPQSPLNDIIPRALAETGEFSVRAMRAAGFRAAAPLMDKAQVVLDAIPVKVGLARLQFVADLLAEGLVYNLPNAMSMTQLEFNKINQVGAAQRTMVPTSRGENKQVVTLPGRLPIYLTTDEFKLDIRTLDMSKRIGTPLDLTLGEMCVRSVNEAIEDSGINGATTVDGQDLYDAGYNAPGLLNAPNANTASLTAAAWDATPVGDTIIAEVIGMIQTLNNDKKYGPFNLYLPTAVSNYLQNDLKANSDKSIWARLEELNGGPRKLRVRVADMLPATKVALVQMTSDVVDVVVGQKPTIIPWSSLNGMEVYNLVMAIMVPRFRSDYDGQSGVCIGTIA